MFVSDRLAALGTFGLYAARVGSRAVTPPWEISEAARHTWFLVQRSALPVLATTTPLGMVMALQGLLIFSMFEAEQFLPPLISVATFRELSPVLASVLVAAQGGSGFAAELGAMRIREELDATEVMAIDPIRLHVVPRCLAVLLACPLLNLLGSIGGLVGGFLSAVVLNGQSGVQYWAELWSMTHPIDLVGGQIKAVTFGLIIGLVATWEGFHATGGAPGVGRAVNRTVVTSATAIIVVNYFLTTALFGQVTP
ncbi:MAG: ABC transporter permease [Myxococcales bacterium]|nr:ABC transporter permease [Myxococcales bacterium]